MRGQPARGDALSGRDRDILRIVIGRAAAASPGRNGPGWAAFVGILTVVGFAPGDVRAAPGQGIRLGGIDPQGPATRAVTALHHNPAMLAGMRGTAVQVAGSAGVDQLRVRRYAIDSATGEPTSSLIDPTSVANPTLGYFIGASFYFDPVAVGVGVYDLSSQYRLASSDPLRFHLAPDPDRNCVDPALNACPPNGGSVNIRQDITLALAWNFGLVQAGAAVHFPRVRRRFAFDNDTELASSGEGVTVRCEDNEDPNCAERVGFKGFTQWIPRGDSPPGFDAAVTVGGSLALRRETIRLGARYRTFPLRRQGEMVLGGVALVCRPDAESGNGESEEAVAPCEVAQPIGATLRERLPQEVALGGSFVLGPSRLWRVDTNLYWMDFCPGGATAGQCPTNGEQRLSLVGLDRDSFILPEFRRYTGKQDLYGADVYTSYRVRSNITVLFATHLASPSVRRSATNPAEGDPWRLGLSVGGRFRLRETNFLLTPGYGIDLFLPRNVRPSRAGFTPSDATDFAAARGDLNADGADAVLEGRARPTNAGRYFGLTHTFTLSLAWGESTAVLE